MSRTFTPLDVGVDDYFGTLVTNEGQPSWKKALSYSALTNAWETVEPGGTLKVGRAYWLWVSLEGSIIP